MVKCDPYLTRNNFFKKPPVSRIDNDRFGNTLFNFWRYPLVITHHFDDDATNPTGDQGWQAIGRLGLAF